jgi:hypothetical protein
MAVLEVALDHHVLNRGKHECHGTLRATRKSNEGITTNKQKMNERKGWSTLQLLWLAKLKSEKDD